MAKRRTTGRKGTKKKYHIEMTSFSIFVWAFCLFFLLTWIFVLGILVGRGFFPSAVSAISDIKGQIGRLQGIVAKNHEPDPPKKAASDPKLAFYDRLSDKKDAAQKEKDIGRPPQIAKKSLEKKDEAPKAVPPPPSAVPKERPPSSGVMHKGGDAPPGEARYTIQLASLELASQAEKMSNRLVKRGFPAYFYDVKVKGKTYYRVRCGRFATRKEAEAFAEKLKKEAGVKGFITRL